MPRYSSSGKKMALPTHFGSSKLCLPVSYIVSQNLLTNTFEFGNMELAKT